MLITSPLWLRLIPAKYSSTLVGKSTTIDKYLCNFSTRVHGESMSPVVSPGTSILLSRCFEKEDLTESSVVLFNDGSNARLGIIRHILPTNPIVYKVSDEKAPKLFHDVVESEIVGVTHNVDISSSTYKPEKRELESFILKSDKYLSELYLAKIPKGIGIEASTLEKTMVFSTDKDKFCSVIVPKTSLTAVTLEVSDLQTQNTKSLGDNAVFNVSTKPNINCMEFGSGPGMLDLKQGKYSYRFLLNHQVLEEIQFEVQ